MKYVFTPVALLLPILVFVYCGSMSTSTEPVTSNSISLDASSVLQKQFTATAQSGAVLTIDSGATLLVLDTSGTYMGVPSGASVAVTLDDGDAAAKVDIAGITTVAQFRISTTVNSKAAELRFMSKTASAIPGMPATGAHWTATLTDTAIHAGSRINLYRISGGTYTPIGSQVVGVPVRVLVKKSEGGGQQTSVSPNGTGSYQTGTGNGAGTSSQATMPSSGVYWNTYSNIPDTSYDVGGLTVGGPLAVQRCLVDELSTAEIIAEFEFAEGVTCATWTSPNDGAQYWCELTQDANGKTTSIKVAATVANIFVLNLDLVRASDRLPIMSGGAYPDGDGVHAPDGSVLPDPYQDASLKFGGAKQFNFLTKDWSQGKKIEGKVQDAGYSISHSYFAKNIYQFDVSLTLDGRKKIEEDILQREGWVPVKGSGTWRSRGLYDQNDTLYINISSHGQGDKVDQMVQTFSGTFTNGNNEPDTVQRMNVAWVIGLTMDSVPATLADGGTSFSVACSLFTGDNAFIFQPYVRDQYGQLSYQTHMVVKAKGVKVNPFTINYKENRSGSITVHMVTTTITPGPDSSVATDDQTVTAQLTMTPYQELLNNIKRSNSATATCASTQTCRILNGSSDSTQTVNVTETYQIYRHWDCDQNRPLADMAHWTGNMSFNAQGMAHVGASLVPITGPDTVRRYFLYVVIEPTWVITSNPNTAGKGQYFDCSDSTWKDRTANIEPHISLTKDDDPQVLMFPNSQDLEDWVAAPTSGKSWSFTGTKYSSDSLRITTYEATLTVSP
jgi:hypothetical protein